MAPLRSPRGVVHWLTAQAVVFGIMAALLGIVANAMFLDAYGSGWLPATYIAIAVAGIVVSGTVSRTAQRFDLLGIALVVLGAAALGIGLAWVVARGGDAAWVSAPLLVLFPILIQLGFVFVGAQAGRVLDIAGIKASFPRIMTGFPVGAVLGGLLGAQLVTWLGRTEDLLLATAVAQGVFAALLWATGRRYVAQLGAARSRPGAQAGGAAEPAPSLRRLLASRFVVLILAYQVLSALGSQLADFLVYDRATAQFPDAADLARFLGGYTAVMNAVSIAFLFLVAGPLLRRFGLRLGIAANPVVLTVLAVGMVVVFGLAGGGSIALLVTVSAARIADIALTDGTTRTSINATYQVLPERARLSVQAAVEGVGVPIAIGISGALILVLNALPFALVATLVVTTLVCAAWSWGSLHLYRAYGPALVDALRRRPLLAAADRLEAVPGDEAVARGLLASPDPRAARLGLELLSGMAPSALAVELGAMAEDPRPDVRISALAGLAAAGDEHARRRLADAVEAAAGSPDAAVRERAARALEALTGEEREAHADLLLDEDPATRCAALESVQVGDAFAIPAVLVALADARTAGPAAGAVERLGDRMVPSLEALLDGRPIAPPSVVPRLVRAVARCRERDEVLRRHVGHPDRELGLVVMECVGGPGPAPGPLAGALDVTLRDDVRHAHRVLRVLVTLGTGTGRGTDGDTGTHGRTGTRGDDAALERALRDELDLVRMRVSANRRARHGHAVLGPALLELRTSGSATALALEALEVLLSAEEARLVLPLLMPGLAADERLRRLPVSTDRADVDRAEWLRDLVEDPDGQWRSSWLRACAIHSAMASGVLGQLDLGPARALGDPVIEELLALPVHPAAG